MKDIFLPLAIILLLTNCGVYLPQSADIPLINKKNDLRIDAGVSNGFKSGAATISYGLTKDIAVQIYGTIGSNKSFMYHGAVGYFKKLDNQKVVEVYAGFGNGYGSSRNHDTMTEISGRFQTYFAQLNYGKLGGKSGIWDLGFGFKPGIIHAKLTKKTILIDGSSLTEAVVSNSFFLEPSLFARIGGEHLKISVKLGGLYVHNLGESHYLPSFPLNLGLGLNFRL